MRQASRSRPNACLNAAIVASGFLRSKFDSMAKAYATTNAVGGIPMASLADSRETAGVLGWCDSRRTWGTIRTGRLVAFNNAVAAKREGDHTSCTYRAPSTQTGGTS